MCEPQIPCAVSVAPLKVWGQGARQYCAITRSSGAKLRVFSETRKTGQPARTFLTSPAVSNITCCISRLKHAFKVEQIQVPCNMSDWFLIPVVTAFLKSLPFSCLTLPCGPCMENVSSFVHQWVTVQRNPSLFSFKCVGITDITTSWPVFFFFFFLISVADPRLFDILKVSFKGAITVSHSLSCCPALTNSLRTWPKGLAASLWRGRDDPWPGAADPGSSRTGGFIQPHEFNETRKIKKIFYISDGTVEKMGFSAWPLLHSHKGLPVRGLGEGQSWLPSLAIGGSNPATRAPFVLLCDVSMQTYCKHSPVRWCALQDSRLLLFFFFFKILNL